MRHIRIFSILAAAALFVACDDFLDPGWPSGGNERDRNPDPIAMEHAEAMLWGNIYNDNTDNLTLFLSYGEYTSDLTFNGEGMELALDILCPAGTGLKLSQGVYECTDDNFSAFHFLSGYEENDLSYPSYVYSSDRKNNLSLELVTDGTVTIESSSRGSTPTYKITAKVQAGSRIYTFTYEGTIDFYDYTESDEPDEPQGSDKLTSAFANYHGTNYSEDTHNFTVVLSQGEYDEDNNFVGAGTELALDLLCPTDADALTGISAGSYKCTYDAYTPYVFLEGLEDNGTMYPSYIYEVSSIGEETLEAITGGSVEVTREENLYTINATVTYSNMKRIFSYTGEIGINDRTSSSAPALTKSPSGRAASVSRSTAVQRKAQRKPAGRDARLKK